MSMDTSLQEANGGVLDAACGPPPDYQEDESSLASDGTCLFSQDGHHLVRCVAEPVTYRIPDGTKSIGPRAFAFQRQLKRVELPDGLESIGKEAFYACNTLAKADLPESVRSIGKRAFFCSAFKHMHISANLTHLGDDALVSLAGLRSGTRALDNEPSITVDPDNPRFFVTCDFLCKREADGSVSAIRYVGKDSIVRIPPDVTAICNYALLGAKATRALHLHANIARIGLNSIVTYQPMDYIRIDLPDGSEAMLYPSESCRALAGGFLRGGKGIEDLARDCDASLLKMKPGCKRTRRIVSRLLNGQLVDDKHRTAFRNALAKELDGSLSELARSDDEATLRGLVELGLINQGNIVHAVEIANRASGVSATHALLDARQRMRKMSAFDLSL